jgi:hypothetical protein
MQPNTTHVITFTGSFSYKSLPDGRKQVILDVGDDVEMSTAPSKQQGELCFVHGDAVGCILAACDALSLVALKRTSRSLYEQVKKLPPASWERLISELEVYPFVVFVESRLSIAAKRMLGKDREKLATYLAYQLDHPSPAYYSYICIRLKVDQIREKHEYTAMWKDVHKVLLDTFKTHKIRKSVLKSYQSCTFINISGTRDQSRFIDNVANSREFVALNNQYGFYLVC